MRLIRPPDLPAELAGRYESVAARLADLDVVLAAALETSLAKVVLTSDFVLRVMQRWPELLFERPGASLPSGADTGQPIERVCALAGYDRLGLD